MKCKSLRNQRSGRIHKRKKIVYNLHNAQVIYSGIKNVGIDMVIYVIETWA